MNKGIKVLSLFDGMACGMIAFKECGIDVEEYYAYEVDKYCIQTATHNFPEIKEYGDVFEADFSQYKNIDYIIGGSPCTYWSIAQKNYRETEASGLGWELFCQYVRAIKEVKPKFFIYENNKSMSQAIKKSISETFGFDPICINSALVSAQNRQRLYWVGKRNNDGTYSKVDIEQPEDRGILLKDILNKGYDLTGNDKAWTLTASYNGAVAWNTIERSQRNMVVEPVIFNTPHGFNQGGIKYEKAPTLTANGSWQSNNFITEPVGVTKDGKSYCLTSSYSNGSGENIGNYVAHTLKKGCKTMVAEPVGTTKDEKSHTIKAQYYKNGIANFVTNGGYSATAVAEPVYEYGLAEPVTTPMKLGEINGGGQGNRIYSVEGKAISQTATSGGMGSNTGLYAIPVEYHDGIPIKAQSLSDGKTYTVHEVKNGLITIKEKEYPIKLADGYYIIRKLMVVECKRLQTVPEWYEFPVSDTQAYKMLGNGWTIKVIMHLIEATLK